MAVNDLLDRLDRVKRTGPDRWIARCPAHNDSSPSLAIRELDDGLVLAHCFAGCEVSDVLAAVGMEMDALFPDKPLADGRKPERKPFSAMDALRCVSFEALMVRQFASKLAEGITLSGDEFERLQTASDRIYSAMEACQ